MAESESSRRYPLIAWSIFLAMCAALSALKLWQNQDYARAQDRFVYHDQLVRRFYIVLDFAQSSGAPTRQAVEAQLTAQGVPFEPVRQDVGESLRSSGRAEVVRYRHPATGTEVELTFDANGQWNGKRAVKASTRWPLPLWYEGERVRSAAQPWGTWTWLGLLLMTGMTQDVGRARRRAQWLLATAIVVSTAVLTKRYPVPRLASDDQLLWLIGTSVMLAASAYVLRHAMTERRTDAGRCAVCDYDLQGNASGICPECGTPIAANAYGR